MIQDQPESPLERALWWSEYVIRNKGAKQLRARGANISSAEYFELELVVVILLVVSLLTISSIFIFKYILSFLFRSKNKIKLN